MEVFMSQHGNQMTVREAETDLTEKDGVGK